MTEKDVDDMRVTNDEIDAAIRAAVPAECFVPNAAARAIYRAGYRAGIEAALADERAWRGSSAPEDIARRFHDAYEHFAPQFGYTTRPESRKAWDKIPQNLRDLMIAVVRNVLIEWPTAVRGTD